MILKSSNYYGDHPFAYKPLPGSSEKYSDGTVAFYSTGNSTEAIFEAEELDVGRVRKFSMHYFNNFPYVV